MHSAFFLFIGFFGFWYSSTCIDDFLVTFLKMLSARITWINNLCHYFIHDWSFWCLLMHVLHVLFRLALLWFHTIVRPFFGLDGSNVRSGADAAQRLIDASKGDFSDAALFLFFQGRVDRLKVRTTIMIKVKGLCLAKVPEKWANFHKVVGCLN